MFSGLVLHELLEHASNTHVYLLPLVVTEPLVGRDGLTIIAEFLMAIRSSSIISSLSSVGSCLTPGSCLTTAPGSVFTCADSNLTNGDCQQVSVLQSGHTYLKGVHLVYLLILYLDILLIHSTGKKLHIGFGLRMAHRT